MLSQPSDELARLREELAQEEVDLAALEDDVEAHSAQLGYLHTEYTLNKTRICHYYEPRLAPLQAIRYAAAQKESLITFQIEWLERKIVEQERRSEGGHFNETLHMKSVAEEYLDKAYESVLRCYEHFSECPEEALRIASQYLCPPDEAIATMELVMKVRGEAPEDCTWKASQVLLSNTYFHDFFATRSDSLLKRCDLLSYDVMNEVERFCDNPHHSVLALYRISTPIGCMGEWLHCVRNYYRVKLVTAPVLLSQNADTGRITEQAKAWLHTMSLGEERGQNQKQQTATPLKTSPSGSSHSTAADAVARSASTDDTELGVVAAVHDNQSEVLPLSTNPSSEAAEMVQSLRHSLYRLRERVRAIEKEEAVIESDMRAKLSVVQGDYDGTMVPLEDQLEETTACFLERAMRKTDPVVAPPSMEAAAALA
ncbi:hypothetical protein JKF63_01638 [Porcisia hertigi]|uniref:Uncharacterized protein n=1 Tax=Porcisia hertigi TaxID=2761500 RepID=A0A836L099_9TRYP|nr:hypothetical protein JKF63_01638 [Porcisia hertigi]